MQKDSIREGGKMPWFPGCRAWKREGCHLGAEAAWREAMVRAWWVMGAWAKMEIFRSPGASLGITTYPVAENLWHAREIAPSQRLIATDGKDLDDLDFFRQEFGEPFDPAKGDFIKKYAASVTGEYSIVNGAFSFAPSGKGLKTRFGSSYLETRAPSIRIARKWGPKMTSCCDLVMDVELDT